MTAHVPLCHGFALSDEEFRARFLELRRRLKSLGDAMVFVPHSNHRVVIDWLPHGADLHEEPSRSTLFRLVPEMTYSSLFSARGITVP